jgi:acid phosphatase (class A)
MRTRIGVLAAAILALAAPVPSLAQGYLGRAAPDALRILPPPPARPSPREAADEAAVRAARLNAQGTPRWALAASDAEGGPQTWLDDFACAIGVRLEARNAPELVALLTRIGPDIGRMVGPPKDRYRRPRPFVLHPAAICTPHDKILDESGSYPSGHTTVGWTYALILAELAPDRATQIMMRGRAYGESRVVCGVHFPSDLEGGRIAAASLVAALHGDRAFRADMDKARAEVEAARRAGGADAAPPDACAVEDQAAAHRPW